MKLKENKGITLIALIITIIILLILAVVTIMAVNGDGIIGKAKQAREDYQNAQAEEQNVLDRYLAEMEGLVGNNTTTGETTIIWTDNGDGTFTSSNGTTVQTGDTLTNEEVLQATGGTQSTYTGTWTVIGIKDGKLKLVSTDNVQENVSLGKTDPKAIETLPNGTDLEKSIWSYKNAVSTLNTVAQTATGIASAESIKIEDIYDILGEENINKGTDYGKVYNYYYDTTNSKVCYKYQTGTDGNANITWSTGAALGASIQTFVNDAGETVVIDSVGDEITLTGNSFSYTLTDEQKEKVGSLATGGYWLASPHLYYFGYMGFGVRCMYSGNISGRSLFYSDGGAFNEVLREPCRSLHLKFKVQNLIIKE